MGSPENDRPSSGRCLIRPRWLWAAMLSAGLLASSGIAWAEEAKPLREFPGYFPLEELDILSSEALSIEINLHGAMLKLIAAATRSEEPEFAELIADLEAVRVRIAPVEEIDLGEVRAGLGRATDWLEERGWDTVVRTREDDEELYIYLREDEGDIAGMAVMAIEAGGEAALINIVGKMDLAQIERLGEALDIPQLSQPEALGRSPKETDGKDSDQ